MLILTSDVQASVFWASGRLEPYIFCDFELQAGSGSAKFAQGEQAGIYVLAGTRFGYLAYLCLSLQLFLITGFARQGSDKICFGWAGGPRFGLENQA